MYEWQKNIREIVDEIDICIKKKDDEALTLTYLAGKLGYSEFYVSRKFRESSGMQLRDYLRYRKLAFVNEPTGRICSWGIPLAECYGVRLPLDYTGEVPEQMLLMDVPEGEYIVFEHGPFDFETENSIVEEKIEKAMKEFDYASTGYRLDTTPDRVFYFYHDCARFWKYIRPVRKA